MNTKNKRLVIIVILVTFCLSTFVSFGCFAQQAEHTCKIAVLIDSNWSYTNDWPETDYLSILRETVSALDYLGYMYDVVDEKISSQQLNMYEMLISITDIQTEKIIEFAERPGKTALILYSIGPELCKKLGITMGNFNLKEEDNAHVVIENSLTQDIASEYGSIPIWGAYNHSYGTDSLVLLENSEKLPIMVEQKSSLGRYIFLLTSALTWDACSYKLIDNIIRDSTNLTRIGGIPYAMDVPVIIRLDDFCTWSSTWKTYADISKKLSIAGIVSELDTKNVAEIKKVHMELIPHGYKHEDLSLLTYDRQLDVITKAINGLEKITGTKANGFFAPYNRINAETTKVCATMQLQWVTTYHGMAKVPRYYYTDTPNNVWVLGARPEYFTDSASIMRALDEGKKQQKPLMFVEHPDTRMDEGVYNDTIATLKQLLKVINEGDGYYLTHAGEFFGFLSEQKKVSLDGSKLIVEDEIKPGLTFNYPGCGRENMAIIGENVLMFYRKGSTVLPALKKGEYSFTKVKNMPILSEIGPGVVVKSATYNPIEKRAQILLESFANKDVRLSIDNIPRGTYSVEEIRQDSKKPLKNITVSSNGKMDISLQLLQDTEVNVTIISTDK